MSPRSIATRLALGVTLLAGAGRLGAQTPGVVTITADEAGAGTISFFTGSALSPAFPLLGTVAPDPGPGGRRAALTYGLGNPPSLTQGDLVLRERVDGPRSDLARFNFIHNVATLVFYSDRRGGADALADVGFPRSGYENMLTLVETGLENGGNGVTYSPTEGQPGYVQGFDVTYVLQSDAVTTPEPSTWVLLATGVVALGGIARRRRTAMA